MKEELANSLVELSAVYLERGEVLVAKKCAEQALKMLEQNGSDVSPLKGRLSGYLIVFSEGFKQYGLRVAGDEAVEGCAGVLRVGA